MLGGRYYPMGVFTPVYPKSVQRNIKNRVKYSVGVKYDYLSVFAD